MLFIKDFRVNKIILLLTVLRNLSKEKTKNTLAKYPQVSQAIKKFMDHPDGYKEIIKNVVKNFMNHPDGYKEIIENNNLMTELSLLLDNPLFQGLYKEALEYKDEVAKKWNLLEPVIRDYFINVLGLSTEKNVTANIVNPNFPTGTNDMRSEIFYAHNNGKTDISYDATYIMHEYMHCLFPYEKHWTDEQRGICHSLIELAIDNELRARLGGDNQFYSRGHDDGKAIRDKLMPLWLTFLNQKGGTFQGIFVSDKKIDGYMKKAQINNVHNMDFAELMQYCIQHYHEYGLNDATFNLNSKQTEER